MALFPDVEAYKERFSGVRIIILLAHHHNLQSTRNKTPRPSYNKSCDGQEWPLRIRNARTSKTAKRGHSATNQASIN
eukprot:1190669-Prorocentrum_minimum.AAC.1